MRELRHSQFAICEHLLARFPYSRPAISAALAGAQRSRLFVDSIDVPSVAVLFHVSTYTILCGDDGKDEVWEFLDSLEPKEVFGKDQLAFIPETPRWEKRLREWGRGCLLEERRLGFRFDPEMYGQRDAREISLRNGARLVPIDAELFRRNVQPSLLPHFGESWDSWQDADEFLSHGFGFMLVLPSDGPVSSCYTYAAGGAEVEVQIQTLEACRGRGYATQVSSTFIGECLRRGVMPHWECNEHNLASIALAKRLGFTETDVRCHLWRTDPPFKTVLQVAVERGVLGEILHVLADGEDPNARNLSGSTALHHAIWAYKDGFLVSEGILRAIASALLERGADVNAVHRGVGTPLDYAQAVGAEKVAALLVSHGGTSSTT